MGELVWASVRPHFDHHRPEEWPPKRIVQTDTHVMILAQMVHDARIIRIGGEHSPPGNYALGNIMRGARLLENETRDGSSE